MLKLNCGMCLVIVFINVFLYLSFLKVLVFMLNVRVFVVIFVLFYFIVRLVYLFVRLLNIKVVLFVVVEVVNFVRYIVWRKFGFDGVLIDYFFFLELFVMNL